MFKIQLTRYTGGGISQITFYVGSREFLLKVVSILRNLELLRELVDVGTGLGFAETNAD